MISNYQEQEQIPVLQDEKANALLPKTLKGKSCSFVIAANAAIANSLRRCIMAEIPTKVMVIKQEDDIKTNDPFLIHDIIKNRISFVPLHQSVKPGVFELHVENKTANRLSVRTSEIKTKEQRHLFNTNIELCVLEPNKFITVKNIQVEEGCLYEPGRGMFAVANQVASICLDEEPSNVYEKTGKTVCLNGAKKHKISFVTNGTMEPKKIIKTACSLLVERLNNVLQLLKTITYDSQQYQLRVNGEEHTIGNIIMREMLTLYPNITVVYKPDLSVRGLTFTVKTSLDCEEVFVKTIKHLIKIYQMISDEF